MTLSFHYNSNKYPIKWSWGRDLTHHLGPKVFDHISTNKVDNKYTLDSPNLFKRYLNQSGEEKNPLSEKEEKIYNKLKSWENKVNDRFTFYIPPEQ